MSRFNPLDIVYAKFPYGGKMTHTPHPVLILRTFNTDKGDFAVVAAGTTAIHKDTFDTKIVKRDNDLLISGSIVQDVGLKYSTMFKFDPVILKNDKMTSGTFMVIPLDDTFLTADSNGKTRLGSIDPNDCRIKGQLKDVFRAVDINKLIATHMELFEKRNTTILEPLEVDILSDKNKVSDNIKKTINVLKKYKTSSFAKKMS